MTHDEAYTRILPFVADPRALPEPAVQDAPVILPGLVLAVAVQQGDRMDFLPRTEMEAMGGAEAVHRRARENARKLPEPRIGAQNVKPWDPTTGIWVYTTEDNFGASRVAILPDMLKLLGPGPNKAGVLVSVPNLRLLLIHIIYAVEGTLTALEGLAQLAGEQALAAAPERASVSPNVFYVAPDYRTQQVAFHTGEKIELQTGGLFGEALRGVPPQM